MSKEQDGELVLSDICLRGDIQYTVNMDNKITIQKHQGSTNALEVIKLRSQQEIPKCSYLKKDFNSWVKDKKRVKINLERSLNQNEEHTMNSNNEKENTQFITFQRAMKVLLIYGQCMGLNPVTAILNHDITKIRFKLYSWRFLYTSIIAIFQTLSVIARLYKLFISAVTITSLVYCCLSFTSWCTAIIFIRIASKWEMLVKDIYDCNLNKYINKSVSFRCNVSCIVFLILAFVELILFYTWKTSEALECTILDYNTFEKIVINMLPSFFDIGFAYNIPTAILLQFYYIITSANSSFKDIFIICISLYLSSILNEINKKILWAADENYLSPSIWGNLREDYNQATRLIRRFDDVFGGLVLLSFATNLFWICLQLFNILENGIRPNPTSLDMCPHNSSWFFHGYEYPIFATSSFTFSMARFTTMCLSAASVNVASLVPASALYRVPSCSYSIEVQRFLDQVHDDVVALTGMKYFHITRELVLSMAGTILTYELVLLQLSCKEF